MQTFDQHLAHQAILANAVAALASFTDPQEPLIRCQWCGNLVPIRCMSEWRSEPMCAHCVESEREEAAAEQLRPHYDQLFGEIAG